MQYTDVNMTLYFNNYYDITETNVNLSQSQNVMPFPTQLFYSATIVQQFTSLLIVVTDTFSIKKNTKVVSTKNPKLKIFF